MCNHCRPHGYYCGWYGNRMDPDIWEMDYVSQRPRYRPVRWTSPAPEDEKTYLEQELQILKDQMDTLQKRLGSLTKK